MGKTGVFWGRNCQFGRVGGHAEASDAFLPSWGSAFPGGAGAQYAAGAAGGLTEPAYSARRLPRGNGAERTENGRKMGKIERNRPKTGRKWAFLVILAQYCQFGRVGACPPRAERIAEASAARRSRGVGKNAREICARGNAFRQRASPLKPFFSMSCPAGRDSPRTPRRCVRCFFAELGLSVPRGADAPVPLGRRAGSPNPPTARGGRRAGKEAEKAGK